MRLTRHNGRSGKDGTYSVKHNDRQFPLDHADHINAVLSDENIYWDCYHGIRRTDETESFDSIEKKFYEENYSNYVNSQNARNEKNRHKERNRTTEQIRHNAKSCPEETIFQIGALDDHVSPDILLTIVTDFTAKFEEKFGSHIHILDWSLHLDEQVPHIHERHVYDAINQYGELMPAQEKALQQLGFNLPDPNQKRSRYNNRKIEFDKCCRQMLFDVCKKHGLNLEEEPTYGGRQHVSKQDYIIFKQREQIENQQNIIDAKDKQIDELNQKVGNIDSFITRVSTAAYDSAIETVAAIACAETQKENLKIIADCREWLSEPDRQAPKEYRDYAVKRLDAVVMKINKTSIRIFERVKQMLTSPQNRRSGIEQIIEKTRESVFSKLHRKEHTMKQDRQRPQNFMGREDQPML